MHHLEKYRNLINKMPFDIRAEVLLAEMLLDNVHAEEIEIATNSVFARNVHHDIEKVEEIEYPTTKKRRLRFVLNRDGLYDLLPEDLFHQPADPNSSQDIHKMMQEVKEQQAREKGARKFFLPYEQEFFRLRVKLEMEERKFMFANSGKVETDVLSRIWNFPEILDEEQKMKLGLLMPVMHRLVGNNDICSFIATDITGDEVAITETNKSHSGFSSAPVMGEALLGDDFILGGEYQSLEPCNNWKITIGDIKQLTQYMPGGRKAEVHKFLSNLMIPLENEVNFELNVSETAREFILGDPEKSGALGFETFI